MTIESVLSQNYASLQYIVIDGGSNDGSIDVISEYSSEIDVFISEPDKGQYFAINKGMSYAKGDVCAWLNADDVYMPWTFKVVNELFSQEKIDWLIGRMAFMNKDGVLKRTANKDSAKPRSIINKGLFMSGAYGPLQQESMFWRKSLWDKNNGLNTSLALAADYDLWIRFSRYADLNSVNVPLAAFRMTGNNRSFVGSEQYIDEVINDVKSTTLSWLEKKIVCLKSPYISLLMRLFAFAPLLSYSYSDSKNKWVLKKRLSNMNPYTVFELLDRFFLYK